jgi:hypothetical protein
VLIAFPAAAGQVNWAHQSGSVQANGSVTVKSLSSGSFAATSNPEGAVVKANQNAATQPPTIVIQATTGNFFNYGTDCFILTATNSAKYLGVGKLSGLSFTGIASPNSGNAAPNILGIALGVMPSTTSTYTMSFRGVTSLAAMGGSDWGIIQMEPIASAIKCYP